VNPPEQSPSYAKMSQASAISLGLMGGRMYRGAVNRCVNLLVHYPEGCTANCAYCGLARKRPGSFQEKSFIHVEWPLHAMTDIVGAINHAPSYVRRTCISMITNRKCCSHTIEITKRLKSETGLPISILISPTILKRQDLVEMKRAGADKIGVAIDLVTSELFDRYRGKGVAGPHKWGKYWEILDDGIEIFGRSNVGVHLMAGMGETEEELVSLMDRTWNMGVVNHLFSFFAEKASILADRPQPRWSSYLRIQLARYLIEEGIASQQDMAFDTNGRIKAFGIDSSRLKDIISLGTPFMTTGCLGSDGEVACNRPFGNCLPDVKQWNYPYLPNEEELDLIKLHIFEMS
jgi:biotin synthase-related radical SAM superfamily protein